MYNQHDRNRNRDRICRDMIQNPIVENPYPITIRRSTNSTKMKDTGYHQLQKLEHIFNTQDDSDIFQDPKQFLPLTRVIDVLGAQSLDKDSNNCGDATKSLNTGVNNLNDNPLVQNDALDDLHQNNPAYTALRKQQDIIEKAIEHLSVNHCSDLNSSVVAVGMVSKKFDDAVGQEKGLRKQV